MLVVSDVLRLQWSQDEREVSSVFWLSAASIVLSFQCGRSIEGFAIVRLGWGQC